jgi:hypothetical protein
MIPKPDGGERPLGIPTIRDRVVQTAPDYPNHLSDVPCPLPRRIERVRVSIASPLVQPSPNDRRVGIRIASFEACSGFTRVTARRIAQPPKVTFVTRLRLGQLPGRAARQLSDLSTIIRVRSSLTGGSRLRGARSRARLIRAAQTRLKPSNSRPNRRSAEVD